METETTHERGILAEFFKDTSKRVRLYSLRVVEKYRAHDGGYHDRYTEYDVDWCRRDSCYLYNMSGCGPAKQHLPARGIFYCSGPVKKRRYPSRWVARDRNQTRQLARLPRHLGQGLQGRDLLEWLQNNAVEQSAVYCSTCRDYLPDDALCKHFWWCDQSGEHSTPGNRCECKNRDECGY